MGSTDGHGLHRVPFLMCYGTVLTSNAILEWQQDNRIEWHHIAPGKPTQTAFVAGRAESNLSRTLKKDELKATRDQARIDAERSRTAVENAGQIITATQLDKFAQAARRRMRGSDGGYRRDHLRALAQRVEVSEREVRIMGSKNTLLRVLAASNGVESAANDVRIYVPEWRRGWDSNPRYGLSPYNGLANRRLQPLGHPSARAASSTTYARGVS